MELKARRKGLIPIRPSPAEGRIGSKDIVGIGLRDPEVRMNGKRARHNVACLNQGNGEVKPRRIDVILHIRKASLLGEKWIQLNQLRRGHLSLCWTRGEETQK